MNSCDPVDTMDPVPNNESRVDRLARWLVEADQQRALPRVEYAKRCWKQRYRKSKGPTNDQLARALRIAGGGQ